MPQKYGPKKNTRRKRGCPRRDKGHRHHLSEETKQKFKDARRERREEFKRMRYAAKAEINSPIPKNRDTLKRYVFIHNWYLRVYEWYMSSNVAMESTKEKFKVSEQTIIKAIKVIRYLNDKMNNPNPTNNEPRII